jgi:hypothetical protein
MGTKKFCIMIVSLVTQASGASMAGQVNPARLAKSTRVFVAKFPPRGLIGERSLRPMANSQKGMKEFLVILVAAGSCALLRAEPELKGTAQELTEYPQRINIA